MPTPRAAVCLMVLSAACAGTRPAVHPADAAAAAPAPGRAAAAPAPPVPAPPAPTPGAPGGPVPLPEPAAAEAPGPGTVRLDGAVTKVRWLDGDTFRVVDGPHAGLPARLSGFNALESYGPVHRWGRWSAEELHGLAQEATRRVRAGSWSCTSGGRVDRYGRLLVACPDAAGALVSTGLAMVFAVDQEPDPHLLRTQREAQSRGAGMWAGGVPRRIVTSLHSAGEEGLPGEPYDRLVDTGTGLSETRRHRRSYAVCEEVCVDHGADRSCMRYVPFAIRYRNRPACLLPRGEAR